MLRDFKEFAHETATIAPFTLLVGANASGKSNFVELAALKDAVRAALDAADGA